MQLKRLQELIRFPERVKEEDRIGLLEWREKHPYAGVLSMLIARSSKVGGHIDQEKDLLRAATEGTFRRPLFELILRTAIRDEAIEVDAALEKWEEPIDDGAEGKGQSESSKELQEVNVPPLNPEEPLQREVLIAAIGRTIEAEVSEWNAEEDQTPSNDISRNDIEIIENAMSSSFANWLVRRASEVGFGESTISNKDASTSQEPLDSHALIDRFIQNQPKIGKFREVESPVQDWAQESILEDPTLVTETMARIYVKQGKLDKARKAYQYLALKFPAKSTYFASQLKNLD
ncbi:MAG: hypothetical protein ACO3MV_07190 [Flavobacteriales bacterium]